MFIIRIGYSFYKHIPILAPARVPILILTVPHSATVQVQLTDQNAVLNIVTNSSAGINSWAIDGQNVLDQQWFWCRVGNVDGPPMIFPASKTSRTVCASALGTNGFAHAQV